ncbi:bifunctional cobinamide kinase and cobinamide phosphate guanylyltransferase [Candidatus Nitrospira nitrosa]|uniref:Adenosylcobinamide kinase n=1 Tax=Candidatus Nitrospira nitrosa TaxID=1742972 RepID=A0A0S4LGV2_9BACT|nr:bifunctional adenosylcobinamide kinase/adenosylcobinamide-phosphate guanylyltransferase [Candidatus Nitrospira nitrosa]CUS36844.1 bifunctional cobinamide kinase and cobinamide phosphate guanylyltransferase [Candidatus Nitrospira nitrosa]
MSPRSPRKGRSVGRPKGRIILVLGGASSGKSEFALQVGGSRGPRAFVATGQGLDEEMAGRIARHQATRSAEWQTVEEPLDVEAWFAEQGPEYRTIVFDCVTLWLSNLLGSGLVESIILARIEPLLEAMRLTGASVIIVSNELGCGLVPAEPSVRAFRDLSGRVNQCLAAGADEAYLVVSGLPLRLK